MYRGVYAYLQNRGQGFTKPYYVMYRGIYAYAD